MNRWLTVRRICPLDRGNSGSQPASAVGQTLANDLDEARRDYCLALHQAWVDATQASWKAYAEFIVAQHRSSLTPGCGGPRLRGAPSTSSIRYSEVTQCLSAFWTYSSRSNL